MDVRNSKQVLDSHWSKRIPLGMKSLETLPQVPALFKLEADETLVYVGETDNLAARIIFLCSFSTPRLDVALQKHGLKHEELQLQWKPAPASPRKRVEAANSMIKKELPLCGALYRLPLRLSIWDMLSSWFQRAQKR